MVFQIPDPSTGHPHPEAMVGTSPGGGATGIVIAPGERVADPWAEGHHASGHRALEAGGTPAAAQQAWRWPFSSCSC